MASSFLTICCKYFDRVIEACILKCYNACSYEHAFQEYKEFSSIECGDSVHPFDMGNPIFQAHPGYMGVQKLHCQTTTNYDHLS